MVNVTALPVVAHPYYPVEAEIVGYLANEYSTPVLLAIFVAGIVAISSLSFAVIKANAAHLRTSEKSTVLWFILSMSSSSSSSSSLLRLRTERLSV